MAAMTENPACRAPSENPPHPEKISTSLIRLSIAKATTPFYFFPSISKRCLIQISE